jgi:hypothetical protein
MPFLLLGFSTDSWGFSSPMQVALHQTQSLRLFQYLHILYQVVRHHSVAPPFLTVGLGLLYSIDGPTLSAKLAGSQIVLGASTGFGMQNSIVAI